MIYILTGNDTKKKNAYLKKLSNGDQSIFASEINVTKDSLFEQAKSLSLFGGYPTVIIENIIKDGDITFSQEDISILKDSETIFIFIEEKLLATELKKFKKYAIIEDFSIQVIKQASKINIFGIADAFSNRDKIGTWILYREAVSQGISPEEISGIIFWKIKTMFLIGAKFFSTDELKIRSSELVSIYHMAHRGECDFVIGLEQFILSSLSK